MGRPSDKEQLILKMLVSTAKSLYGLEMVERSENRLKRGSVYWFLERLEEAGLVESEREAVTAAVIPRRMYRITARGERVLKALESLDAATLDLPLAGAAG